MFLRKVDIVLPIIELLFVEMNATNFISVGSQLIKRRRLKFKSSVL